MNILLTIAVVVGAWVLIGAVIMTISLSLPWVRPYTMADSRKKMPPKEFIVDAVLWPFSLLGICINMSKA